MILICFDQELNKSASATPQYCRSSALGTVCPPSQGHSRKISGRTPTRKSPRQHPQIGLAYQEEFPEDRGKMRGDEWKAFVYSIKTTQRQTICLSNQAFSACSV
jgi:hypothetical protein